MRQNTTDPSKCTTGCLAVPATASPLTIPRWILTQYPRRHPSDILVICSGWNNLIQQTPDRPSKACFSGGDMPEFRDICGSSVTDAQQLVGAGPIHTLPSPQAHTTTVPLICMGFLAPYMRASHPPYSNGALYTFPHKHSQSSYIHTPPIPTPHPPRAAFGLRGSTHPVGLLKFTATAGESWRQRRVWRHFATRRRRRRQGGQCLCNSRV